MHLTQHCSDCTAANHDIASSAAVSMLSSYQNKERRVRECALLHACSKHTRTPPQCAQDVLYGFVVCSEDKDRHMLSTQQPQLLLLYAYACFLAKDSRHIAADIQLQTTIPLYLLALPCYCRSHVACTIQILQQPRYLCHLFLHHSTHSAVNARGKGSQHNHQSCMPCPSTASMIHLLHIKRIEDAKPHTESTIVTHNPSSAHFSFLVSIDDLTPKQR
jgi:hypothetical protein